MKQEKQFRRKVVALASHRFALAWLSVISFTESIFQPIPPDLMLAPMSMARPRRWVYYATWCTVASAAGGVGGWLVGYFVFELIEPWMMAIPGWEEGYPRVLHHLQRWGVWFVFLSGFTPLPYKIFTVSAGVLAIPLPGFVLASLVGRGLRFYLVAWTSQRTARWVTGQNTSSLAKPE